MAYCRCVLINVSGPTRESDAGIRQRRASAYSRPHDAKLMEKIRLAAVRIPQAEKNIMTNPKLHTQAVNSTNHRLEDVRLLLNISSGFPAGTERAKDEEHNLCGRDGTVGPFNENDWSLGIMNNPSILSGIVKEFIRQCPRRETVRDRTEVAQVLRQNGIPVFEALLDFQEQYGGMHYEFGGLKDQSIVLDAMGPSLPGGGLPKVMKHGDEEIVECLYFRDIYWDRSCYMDRYGTLYVLLMNGELMFFENRAETFIENQAVLSSLLGKQKQWVTNTVYESQVSAWISNAGPAPILLTPSDQEASQWWKSPDERLYVHIKRVKGKDAAGTAYAAEADDLAQLTSGDVYSARGFPFNGSYYPEKKLLYTDDIRQQFLFNRKLYNNGDYAKVTIAHVQDTREMYLYLTGQKDYPVERLIEDFLLRLPGLELPAGDYDDTLIGYAREQGDEMILKLMSHIAGMEYRYFPSRSAAEQMVDGLLYREFLRRMALFADAYSISAHPLYFNA